MIVAMTTARLEAATALLAAGKLLYSARSYICWKNNEHRQIDAMVEEIDVLVNKVMRVTGKGGVDHGVE